jgi:hypothetical protein
MTGRGSLKMMMAPCGTHARVWLSLTFNGSCASWCRGCWDRPSIDTLWAQYRGVETGTSILPNGTLNIGHKARAVPPDRSALGSGLGSLTNFFPVREYPNISRWLGAFPAWLVGIQPSMPSFQSWSVPCDLRSARESNGNITVSVID